MNRIDYSKTGGIPLVQEHLDFIQQIILRPLAGIAAHFGDSVIVSGVLISGGVAGNGWVVVDGEMLPFVGGSIGSDVVIVENVTAALFGDGIYKDVYYNRYATFGAGAGSIPFSSFKRLTSAKDIELAILKPGMIVMWSGAVVNVPEGWALCDGSNGTPNLSGRFIVGYDSSDSDYDAIGKTGGEKAHLLLVGELPPHQHPLPVDGGGTADRQSLVPSANSDERLSTSDLTGSTGGNTPHENRPPYYTLAFIMKR